MIDCRSVQNLLPDYVLAELDDETTQRICRHLRECPECNQEKERLRELYDFGDVFFGQMKEGIPIPAGAGYVKLPEYRRRGLRLPVFREVFGLKYAAACAVVLILFFSTYISPTAAYYASKIPVLGQVFTTVDEGALVAHEEGFGQRVAKTRTINGAAFMVDEVIIDQARTLLLFRIKLPEYVEFDGGMPEDVVLEDQFGYSYRFSGASAEASTEKKEISGVLEFPPLKTWARKLTFRTTALNIHKDKEQHYILGNWEFDFAVDPLLAKRVTREIKIDKEFSVDGVDIHFTKAVLAPSQTAVFYEYKFKGTDRAGREWRHREELLRQVKLIDDSGREYSRLGGGGGTSSALGKITGNGVLNFSPVLFSDAGRLNLEGAGFAIDKSGMEVLVPLDLKVEYPMKHEFLDGTVTIDSAAAADGHLKVRILTGDGAVNSVYSVFLTDTAGKQYNAVSMNFVDKVRIGTGDRVQTGMVQEIFFNTPAADPAGRFTMVIREANINIDSSWRVAIPLGQEGER